MIKSIILHTLLLVFPLSVLAQSEDWTMEGEDNLGEIEWKGNTCDIDAPKGLTLWNKNKMTANCTIRYEARIVKDRKYKNEAGEARISDMNCFVMADKCGGLGGRFVDNYGLSTYYVGYGGNWNTTTRFRRYTGDERGVSDAQYRPRVLKEYTDAAHLLEADRWYAVKIEIKDGRFRYWVDDELLVDYVDPEPLTEGFFGFRTTLSHAQLRNFRYECKPMDDEPIVVRRIVGDAQGGMATFGVPFARGEKTDNDFCISAAQGTKTCSLPYTTWRLASWPDSSAKWQAFCVNVPNGSDSLLITKQATDQQPEPWNASEEMPPFYVTVNNSVQKIETAETESKDDLRKVTKYTGQNFIIRTYEYASGEKKLVHTLIVDSALNKDGLQELSVHFKVAMHGEAYERYVEFDGENRMSVQPLIARRRIDMERNDPMTRQMIESIAKWDGFRLSQLSANGYSVRKRATSLSPWIGTHEGHRHSGLVTVGDSTASTSFRLKDFWESFPSTLQVDEARSDTAVVTISLYSPEAEAYNFAHYDTVAHTLEAAYEDVQPGLSTAWGIGRTSTIYISSKTESVWCCTPEYLHRKRAFGVWSLPTVENEHDSLVEKTLSDIMTFYEREIDRNGWYGFFNYGDIMHSYDSSRDEWRYDVGGYAWDNTELGTPSMMWYEFLRTGDPKVWRMAEAMTRHCSEVDTYHTGPHAGLGSRHNVIHWGCGAKESRISEAWWNRFYYYLTADERVGDIMHEVVDSDTLLYELDPMRLAQPREEFPCTAPARLRIGPDWLGYASNWMTEIERRGATDSTTSRYKDKLLSGMNSIAGFRHGFFEGPKALGYDPATGVISNECDSTVIHTNHLMPIMGGFEIVGEMEAMIEHPAFYEKWLEYCKEYKETAKRVSHNGFLIPRLSAYAAWRLGDEEHKRIAWDDLLHHLPLDSEEHVWTNDCSTWTLDAIFLKEVIRK